MGARFNVLLVSVVVLAVVVGVIAGQSQPRTTAAPAPTSTPTPLPTPQVNHVDIVDNPSGNSTALYLPATLLVRVGQPVTWVNTASDDHSALADGGAFNSDVLSPGQAFRWTPKAPGQYPYSDFLHPDMHGTIIVQP